jgi:hypothetical protein
MTLGPRAGVASREAPELLVHHLHGAVRAHGWIRSAPALILAFVGVATAAVMVLPSVSLLAELLQLHPQEAVFAPEHLDAHHLGRRLGWRRRRSVSRVRAADLAASSVCLLCGPCACSQFAPRSSLRHVCEAPQLVSGEALEAVERPLGRRAERPMKPGLGARDGAQPEPGDDGRILALALAAVVRRAGRRPFTVAVLGHRHEQVEVILARAPLGVPARHLVEEAATL